MWHPSDRLFAKESLSTHLSHDRDHGAPGSNGMHRTAAEGAFDFQHDEQNTGGTKFPTRIDLSAHHPETGEELGHARYYPPKRRNAPLHIDEVDGHAPGAASALLNEIEARHPGSPTKFLHEVRRNNNNPDVTGHAHEHAGQPTDWDTHYPGLADTVHRGLVVRLPRASARVVNSADATKEDHLAELHAALPPGPSLGMHWTENDRAARQFAHNAVSDARTDIPVVLHAHTPAQKDLETRRDHLYRGGVFPYGDAHSQENEVPLRKGRKVSVTGISWRPDAAHPDADEHGWVHHTYDEPVQHTGAVEIPFSMWHMATQEPDQVTDEPEADVSDLPHTCSYCGSQEFETPENTGRGLRAVCSACGGAMLRTDDGQWTPAGPGATNNHPRPEGDPNSGGVGGAANVGVDPDRMNDASARHSMLKLADEIPWCAHLYHGNCTYPGDKLPNGTILGIPQDRGPCPWKQSVSMQAVCPISEPGPMAVQFREGGLHEAMPSTKHTPPNDLYFDTHDPQPGEQHFDEAEEKNPGWSHHLLRAHRSSVDNGGSQPHMVGSLYYSHQSDGPVPMVKVHKMRVAEQHRSQGIASAMQDELHRQYPGHFIDHGDRTDDGHGWAAQYETPSDHIMSQVKTSSWTDVREKAKRIRREGRVTIIVASTDGVAGEVKGDEHVYETAITWVPGTNRTAAWSCGCKWGAYAWGPTWDGRPCSHVLAMRFEAQSRSAHGREIELDQKRPDWLKPQTSIVTQYERPSDKHPDGRDLTRRAVPPGNMRSEWSGRSRTRRSSLHSPAEIQEIVAQAFAEAKTRLDGDDDPAEVLGHLITAGIPHDDAQNIVLAARGRVALRKVAKKCPECGAELDATDSQCDDCGAVLPDRSVTHRASWGDDEQRCPHCGGYIGPEAFKIGKCPHCGHALAHKTSSLTDSGDSYHVHEPSGARYRLGEEGYNTAVAYHQLSNGGERRAGYLSWFGGKPEYDGANVDGGVIHKAYVSSPHRRRGVASALLDYARTQHPDQDIRHSRALSDDGKAWAANTASLQTFSVWDVPGWEGAQGPFEDEYSEPHVYARDIHSGAGNCVCGGGLGDPVHLQAAPGVDVPEHQRTASSEIDYRPHRTQDARSDAPVFGKGVDDWGLTLVDCPQCGGKSGCGHCGGTGQVISTGGTTANPTPDQNPVAGDAIREDGISDVSSLHPQFAAKKGEGPSVAGVVLKAADTGRILLLQRGIEDEKDPARGLWESPGGHIEDGDKTTLHAGLREWEEEVGQPFPEGGVVTHAWTSPNGIYQGHVVVIPRERDVVMHDGRVVPNPDDPSGDHAEQAAWWDPDHARKNPALRPEFKQTPWSKVKEAGADCGLKVEALLQRQGAAWDSLYSLEEAQPVTPPPHSDSENPISSGFLTTQDPQSWSEVTHKPHHLMPADSLDSPVATLHSVPEGALPFTDGDIEDSTSGTTDEYGTQTNDDDTQSLDGDTDGIPDTEQEGSPMEPLGGIASKRSVADIVEQFQRTAGAQMLQSGSGGGSDVGFSDGEIAAKAKERLAGLSKTALKNFTFDEQQELIGEGKGTRARNFGDLDVTGTHYQAINEALAAADLSDDDILIL